MKPLAIDLYCGLGGWAEGFLAEGFDVIGFDIERRPYSGKLVLQDVLTLWGSQLKDATVIVGSSPCQEFSYRAMPWKRAKELPPPNSGIQLFNAQFFLQKEASEAAGRYIPMVVENVKGAQPWVGRARWHYGSYYLWGDVPAVMPFSRHKPKRAIDDRRAGMPRLGDVLPIKNNGGSWFGIRDGKEAERHDPRCMQKMPNGDWGIKQGGEWWHDPQSMTRKYSSRSEARKAASAAIAKIPFPLARWIAKCFKPMGVCGV